MPDFTPTTQLMMYESEEWHQSSLLWMDAAVFRVMLWSTMSCRKHGGRIHPTSLLVTHVSIAEATARVQVWADSDA